MGVVDWVGWQYVLDVWYVGVRWLVVVDDVVGVIFMLLGVEEIEQLFV